MRLEVDSEFGTLDTSKERPHKPSSSARFGALVRFLALSASSALSSRPIGNRWQEETCSENEPVCRKGSSRSGRRKLKCRTGQWQAPTLRQRPACRFYESKDAKVLLHRCHPVGAMDGDNHSLIRSLLCDGKNFFLASFQSRRSSPVLLSCFQHGQRTHIDIFEQKTRTTVELVINGRPSA